MPDVSPAWTSFNAGELSPRLDGRVDIPAYMKGGKICLNFLPTVQGPLVRRGGTRYIGLAVGIVGPSLLIRFSRSQTQSFVLEFGDHVLKVYFNGAPVLSGGFPLIITTPYAQGELFNADQTPALQAAESVDEIFLTHPNHPPQILSYLGGSNFTLAPLAFFDGPWKDGNADKTMLMRVSGPITVGSTTQILSDKPFFNTGHVGALFRLHQQDLTQIKPWAPGQKTPVVAVGVLRRSGFNTYRCEDVSHGAAPVGGTTLLFVQTGSQTLTHTVGNAWDGDQSTVIDPIGSATYYSTGCEWSYQDCGYGVLKITSVTPDGLTATGTVTRQFPVALLTQKSYLWELGAWNANDGYPSTVTFYNQRLAFGNNARHWESVVGDFPDFADLQFGQVVADSALTVQVLSDQANTITWMCPQTALILGTNGGEFVISQQSTSDPFGPTNVRVSPQSNYGGRACGAIRVQANTVFVQQNGLALREFSYVFANDAYQSLDLTVESDHITGSGVVGMTWAKNPWYIIWCVRADGTLIGLTYNPEQAVHGWHRHDVGAGGQVVSATCVPSADGTVDDLYLCVRRVTTFGDVTQTYYTLEKLEQPIDVVQGDAQQDAFYVDCGLTFDNVMPMSLNVSGEYNIQGGTVFLLTPTSAFAPTDIGRFVHYDYTLPVVGEDGLPHPQPAKAVVEITAFNFTTSVTGIVRAVFPLLGGTIPALAWRMTVTKLLGASMPVVWQGQTLSILADGAAFPDVVLPQGAIPDITLPTAASLIQIGLRSPAVWKSMRPDMGDPTGTAIGKQRRVERATVRVLDSSGVQMGRSIDNCDPIEFRDFQTPNDTPPPLLSGNSDRIDYDGTFDDDGRVMIVCNQPLPATIAAIGVRIEMNEDS